MCKGDLHPKNATRGQVASGVSPGQQDERLMVGSLIANIYARDYFITIIATPTSALWISTDVPGHI
jgi:hypothetical protein